MKSNIVDAAGKKVAAGQASIPIIPRYVDFDWDAAYSPMMPDEEAKLMKSLQEKYKEDEALRPIESEASDAAKLVIPEGMDTGKDDNSECKVTPLFTDKDNPFNIELNANGRANVDLRESSMAENKSAGGCGSGVEPDDAETAGAVEEDIETHAKKTGDCTVTPDALELNGDQKPV